MDAMYSTPRGAAARQHGRAQGGGSSRRTPRILGRYTPAPARSALPVSPASSRSDADTDADSADEYPHDMRKHKQSARKPRHLVHRIERTGSHGISAEELESSSTAFRGYLSNSHEGSQDIALLLMLRNWHTMAQEARARRNQLQRHWGNATAFYKQSLMMCVFSKWRSAANRAADDEASTYRIVQIALADMTRKNSLLRQVVGRLVRFRDMSNQINNYHEDSSYVSSRYAHGMLGHVQQSDMRQQQQQKKKKKRQQSQEAVRSTMSIITQNGARQNSGLGRAMLKRMFSQWREAAAVNKSAEIRADNYYRGTSIITVFGGLQTLWNSECEKKDVADDHLRKTLLRNCLFRWNKKLHVRREQLLQSRAVQDIARRRDHKRRRVLLLAWREVAERIRRSEANAGEFAAAKKKALLSMCINQWSAASGPYEERRVAEAAGDYSPDHVADRVDTCDRAISVQSNLMSPLASDSASLSAERLALVRRVREAEARASQYKRRLVDPDRAKHDLIELDVDLEMRLTMWQEYVEKRTYSFVLQRLRHATLNPASRRQKRELASNVTPDMDDLDMRERVFEKTNKHLIIEANFMRHRLPLRDTLDRWRRAIGLLADKREHADEFCYDLGSTSNRKLSGSVFSRWREALRDRRNIYTAAVGIHRANVRRQFLNACLDLQVLHAEMMDRATAHNHRKMFARTYEKLVEVQYRRCMSRPLGVTRDSAECVQSGDTSQDEIELEGEEEEEEVVSGYSTEEDEEQYQVFVDEMYSEDAGLADETEPEHVSETTADSAQMRDLECMHECFSAWRELINKFQNIQYLVIEKLPVTYRDRVLGRNMALGEFEWELVYRSQLIGRSFQTWRKVLETKRTERRLENVTVATPAVAAADKHSLDKALPTALPAEAAADTEISGDEDGPNAEQLRKLESVVAKSVARRTRKAVFHRLVLETRCRLFEKKLDGRRLDKLISSFTQRAKQAHVAREKARAFAIQSSIHNWSNSFFVHSQGLDNAAVQANGTLVDNCLRHWIEQAKKRPAKRTDPKLYLRAGAFRWEKQARRALSTWMRVSSDKRIQVRLAQKDTGAHREQRLTEIADEWYSSRIAKDAFVRMRMATEEHLLLQRMQARLATAWSDTNSARHALLTWRSRSSPTGSMFFSTGSEM
ncbi:hypothetical protein LPJ56_002578 [Coemansia sp. RSA 2599]|nr:hypothetical protein LPJ56_002578 [Coemansia sp. RSA 2599]